MLLITLQKHNLLQVQLYYKNMLLKSNLSNNYEFILATCCSAYQWLQNQKKISPLYNIWKEKE